MQWYFLRKKKKSTALHFDVQGQAKPVRFPRGAGNRQQPWSAPWKLLIPSLTGKSGAVPRVPEPAAAHSCISRQRVPGRAPPARLPARPPARLPATLLRARSGWGLAACGDAAECAGLGGWSQPAGRRAGAARAARRVAVTGHRALAPRARPLSIHSEVLDWATPRRAPGATALQRWGFFYKETQRTGKKEFHHWDALDKVFWEKDGRHTRSQSGSKLIFPCCSLRVSVSWIPHFQHYRFSKI